MKEYRSLNDFAEVHKGYASRENAERAIERYGHFDGSVVIVQNSAGRFVVVIINPPFAGAVVHHSPFIAWA